MPNEAGVAGLLFASRKEMLVNPPCLSVWILIPEESFRWKYFGEYGFIRNATMTPAEFTALTNEVNRECVSPSSFSLINHARHTG
jgi:hypothetical protein